MIPSFVQSHGHCTDEGFDPRGGLIVRGSEAAADVLVVEYLDLECEVFLELGEGKCTFLMIMTRKGSLMPRVSV